jgi:hypothetical protein
VTAGMDCERLVQQIPEALSVIWRISWKLGLAYNVSAERAISANEQEKKRRRVSWEKTKREGWADSLFFSFLVFDLVSFG